MSNFDFAIKILRHEELKYVDPPASLGAAIRVLEAARKVDKERCLLFLLQETHPKSYSKEGESGLWWELKGQIRSLLAALPEVKP